MPQCYAADRSQSGLGNRIKKIRPDPDFFFRLIFKRIGFSYIPGQHGINRDAVMPRIPNLLVMKAIRVTDGI
jgi:hypothetical protein